MQEYFAVGIDVGSSSVKSLLLRFDDQGGREQILAMDLSKIRKRDTREVIKSCFENVLVSRGLTAEEISYIATTGEGEMVDFRRGHFYSMTCHARGALFLNPDVRAVVDVGALHAKALVMDDRSKVLGYRMTSQCASGSGQFLENISRYLGIGPDEVGPLSIAATKPEVVSSICAVLAETDVINMVSRGIQAGDILKGVHLSMADRIVKLLRTIKASGRVLVTGGLANDAGFVHAMQELADGEGLGLSIERDELSLFAGALGAAIWGGFRHLKLMNSPKTGVMPL